MNWQPYLLRPDTPEEGSPLPDYVKAYVANPNNPLFARAKTLGLTMRHDRQRIPPTRRAHRAAEAARRLGAFEAFHRGVLERYWSHAENLNDWAVLRRVATDAGLDADALVALADSPDVTAHVDAELARRRAVGVDAVPTFLINERYLVSGAQPADAFADAFTRLGLS